MKRFIFGIVAPCIIFVSSHASAFDSIRAVSLQNNHGVINDYQIVITFDSKTMISQGKMQADCSDLRFLDFDKSTVIPHWVESGCNTYATRVWVRVPQIPATSLSYIYMIYGDPLALNTGDPDKVFDFYDGFDGSSLDPSKWNIERNDGLTYYLNNSKLLVKTPGTDQWGRFIVNSNYKFHRSVNIEFQKTDGLVHSQIGHLVHTSRMEVTGVSGLVDTYQTWAFPKYERYIHGVGAAGCEARLIDVSYNHCYPNSATYGYPQVGNSWFVPVGDGWVDSFGQRMGVRADTLGISVINSRGYIAPYNDVFSVDWIRVRSYVQFIPSHYIENELPYSGTPVTPPVSGADCSELQAQLDAANQTIEDQQSQINDLNDQLAALQAQIDALLAQNAALTQQNADLQNQLTLLNAVIAGWVDAVERSLGVTIPGVTSVDQMNNLITAIGKLNNGRDQGIRKELNNLK